MIFGIGCDLIEIERIKKSCLSHRFVDFCFSKSEQREYGLDYARLAGCFAAKEAFSKALGTGVRGFGLNEVSVSHDELGKPFLELDGRAKEIAKKLSINCYLSISDTKTHAMAMAVLEVAE